MFLKADVESGFQQPELERNGRGLKDTHRRRGGGELPGGAYESARCGNSEVSGEGGAVVPFLQEYESKGVFNVAVDGVRAAARLAAGTGDMLQAQRQQLIDAIGPPYNAAGDENHGLVLYACLSGPARQRGRGERTPD
jgi:hypothetical protein